MKIIDIINLIGIYSIILPIVFYIINFRAIKSEFLRIFFYLSVCLLVETALTINYFFKITDLTSLIILFTIFELVMILRIFSKYFGNKVRLVFWVIISLFFILSILKISNILDVEYSLFLGGGKMLILLIALNSTLVSFNENISNWFKVVNFAFLQYSVIGIVIYSFASFFIENKEFMFFYILLNLLSNILLYSLITYSMYLCKREYSLV